MVKLLKKKFRFFSENVPPKKKYSAENKLKKKYLKFFGAIDVFRAIDVFLPFLFRAGKFRFRTIVPSRYNEYFKHIVAL